MNEFEKLRKEYEQQGLRESDVDPSPFVQFRRWFDEAVQRCPGSWFEPNACYVATADAAGRVTNRTVLLKKFDESGLYFFTNLRSEKSRQIAANSVLAMLFHWPYLGRQLRVEGRAQQTSRELSETYFHSRPRGAQLAAWASSQSEVAESREQIDQRCREFEQKFADQSVPLPEQWGGYLVTPHHFEFWQGQVNRLHDRIRYRLLDGQWRIDRLYP